MWAPTAGSPIIKEHLESLKKFPPRQAADTLSVHVALEKAMAMLEKANAGAQ